MKEGKLGLEFSACGDYDGGAGQCIDRIAVDYPHDDMVQRIATVWRKWHLNGMKAGLPLQEAALEAWKSAGNAYEFVAARNHLMDLGLYDCPVPDGIKIHTDRPDPSYRYGHGWVHAEIPADVLEEIHAWGTAQLEPLYVSRAKAFFARNGLKLRVTLSNSKPAQWAPAGNHYRVTISGTGRRLTFDFWGSVAQAWEHETPSAYDVLTCVASDYATPDDFEDFCSTYGYDTDSIQARQTFRRADRFAKRLRDFFTEVEASEMQEF